MDLINYLQVNLRNKYNLRFKGDNNNLHIYNFYYSFKLKKIDRSLYQLKYTWKLGILSIFLQDKLEEMNDIYKVIKEFSADQSLLIDELHYHKNKTILI